MDSPRKSGRQRRLEIRERRRQRALAGNTHSVPAEPGRHWPAGAVAADPAELDHNNTYGMLPLYYADRAFICRDCGSAELWTAKQQKWWYEIAKGNINSTAVRCRSCRTRERTRQAEARRIHLEGLARKTTPPTE
ncbi:MAG: zinc-ribbon domain-containing protein [Pedobacter sp.]|nr:zinc-ribbon domain-containing protein [Pedobacter sp.]